MSTRPWLPPLTLVALLAVPATPLPAAEPAAAGRLTPAEVLARYEHAAQTAPTALVYRDHVTANWLPNDSAFWYRNDLRDGAKEFVLVDPSAGDRRPAFDHARLASALSAAAGRSYRAEHLPFDAIAFGRERKAVLFTVAGTKWACDLSTYSCRPTSGPGIAVAASIATDADSPTAVDSLWPFGPALAPEFREAAEAVQPQPRREARPVKSPDGRWSAVVRDRTVVLVDADGKEADISPPARDGARYGMLNWAPGSQALVYWQITPGEEKEVHLIESSPAGGGRARLKSRPYALPGDRFTSFELRVYDVAGRAARKLDVEPVDFGYPTVHWARDGRTFTYEKVDRGHQRFRLIEVDPTTGTSRNVIDEKSDTFIWTTHFDGMNFAKVTRLAKTEEVILSTEESGWRQFQLVDLKTGARKPITAGEFVVRGIERIDEENRQLWFRACGRNAGEDPYHVHYYRVNFDGTGLVALTDGNGTHRVQFSPGGKYLIDAYSRADLPPVTELRRTADGTRVCGLERADVADLRAAGWEAPEVFTAKGRDGKTDIWGLIHRPRNFDPSKKYPVIEAIYAGPHGSHVPKAFAPTRRFRQLTDLGFVVAQIDGMGTANRSKAFHDVCWKNLKDAGFPDRILWHKAAAAKHPFYDATRVGIYGTSAGGQNALGALLFHGDFYSAAMAACGCHDNRMDKSSWNEQWMGYPVGPQYAACSNVDNARRLTGKLLLIVGEQDTNVPPESTLRVVDALVKAGKDFDLLVVPGMGHSDGGAYGMRRMQDFFVRHLHGAAPPDRNRPPAKQP